MSERVALVCPGRGSYTAAQLGSLAGLDTQVRAEPLRRAVEALDAQRVSAGAPGLREMDAAERFDSQLLQGANAAPLTFVASVLDAARLDPARVRVVAVAGNSMGLYTALYCAGALDLEAALSLVQVMGRETADVEGGQLVYPVVDAEWRLDPEARDDVRRALETVRRAGHAAGRSIRFGGFEVLCADEDGVRGLQRELPARRLGERDYPIRLHGHAPFHSSLMSPAAERGRTALAELQWRRPTLPLVDGRGAQWRRLGASPSAMAAYTLDTQVVQTFDFSAAVRVLLREYAPDRLVLLGPGESLGAAVAQVLIGERWQGIDSRDAFRARQAEEPLVVSMAREEQAQLLCE